MLEISGLSHSYGDQAVLEDLDLKVAEGELISLVGPSGCGKSTLMRCISGLQQPQAGGGRRAHIHGDAGHVVGIGGDVTARIERHAQLLDKPILHRAQEAHRQQDQIRL